MKFSVTIFGTGLFTLLSPTLVVQGACTAPHGGVLSADNTTVTCEGEEACAYEDIVGCEKVICSGLVRPPDDDDDMIAVVVAADSEP